MLTEFGGIALALDKTWGYFTCKSPAELEKRYAALLTTVNGLKLLAGFCYTQFADTYQEANGLLYANREPKFPLARMLQTTRAEQLHELQLGDHRHGLEAGRE